MAFTLLKVKGSRNQNFLVDSKLSLRDIVDVINNLDTIQDFLDIIEFFDEVSINDFASLKNDSWVANIVGDNGILDFTIIFSYQGIIEL